MFNDVPPGTQIYPIPVESVEPTDPEPKDPIGCIEPVPLMHRRTRTHLAVRLAVVALLIGVPVCIYPIIGVMIAMLLLGITALIGLWALIAILCHALLHLFSWIFTGRIAK